MIFQMLEKLSFNEQLIDKPPYNINQLIGNMTYFRCEWRILPHENNTKWYRTSEVFRKCLNSLYVCFY